MLKPAFQTRLAIRYLEEIDRFELTYDLCYKGSLLVNVPAGYRTDLTSVPWYARSIIPVVGHHVRAAVLHDYLLTSRLDIEWKACNGIMREAMKADGVSGFRYYAISFGIWLWRVRFGSNRKSRRHKNG